MKKRLWNILFGVLALAALTGVLFLLNNSPEPKPDQAEDSLYSLTRGKGVGDIGAITIENEYSRYTVTFSGSDGYQIDAAGDLPLDTEKLERLFSFLGKLNAQIVEREAEDISLYGLDAPQTTVSIEFLDGQSVAFYLGVTISAGTYAQIAEENTVCLLSSAQAACFFWDPRAYISPMVTDRTIGTLYDKVVFAGSVRSEAIVLELNPERQLSGVDYVITSPKQRPSGRAAGILSALSEIRAVEAAEIFPDRRTIEKYGLGEQAYCVMTAESGGRMLEITASAPTASGHFYMMLSGRPVIYYMDSKPENNEVPLYWYGALYQDFLSAYIFHPVFESLSGIDVSTGDGGYSFTIVGEGSDAVITLGGRQIDYEAFHSFFKLLATAPNEGFNTAPVPEAAPVILTITYRYKENGRTPRTLTFYESGPRKAVCALDSDPEYILGTSYLDKIFEAVRNL